jgi:hypothetical protein
MSTDKRGKSGDVRSKVTENEAETFHLLLLHASLQPNCIRPEERPTRRGATVFARILSVSRWL